jgi:phospholipid-binding lipoprotein MlaA
MRGARWAAIAAVGAWLGACATPPADSAERAAFERTNDPFEPTNRVIFGANMFVDKWAIEPVAEVYRDGVPELLQIWIRNGLRWAHEPVVLANNLLQADMTTAGRTTARFMINTLLGPVGLRDMAKQAGYGPQDGDFGQTMHVWGLPEGPYIVLPLLGPSNVRDGIGMGVDALLDPIRYLEEFNESGYATWGRFAMQGLDERAQNIDSLDEIKRSSVDFYAQLRSIVRQRRAAQLHEPSPDTTPDATDLYSDPAAGAKQP